MKVHDWFDRRSHPTLDALFSVLSRSQSWWPAVELFPSEVGGIVEAKAVRVRERIGSSPNCE